MPCPVEEKSSGLVTVPSRGAHRADGPRYRHFRLNELAAIALELDAVAADMDAVRVVSRAHAEAWRVAVMTRAKICRLCRGSDNLHAFDEIRSDRR